MSCESLIPTLLGMYFILDWINRYLWMSQKKKKVKVKKYQIGKLQIYAKNSVLQAK